MNLEQYPDARKDFLRQSQFLQPNMPRVRETIENFLRFVGAGDAELAMHSYGPVIDLYKTSDRDSRYTCYIIFLIWGIPSVPTFHRLNC